MVPDFTAANNLISRIRNGASDSNRDTMLIKVGQLVVRTPCKEACVYIIGIRSLCIELYQSLDDCGNHVR